MSRRARLLSLFALCFLIACTVAPLSAADLSGQWSGGWSSTTTGHKGPLQATFQALNDTDYEVQFRGRFFKIFPFRYRVVLSVVETYDDGRVRLEGASYLGRMFGTFTYQAEATDASFRADFASCKDAGVFWLNRCCP